MKSFLFKIFLAAIPFLAYATIFIVFEPYNYWGLKPLYTGEWTTPLARVRQYLRSPSENIIIGDSRMNHFDLDLVEKYTGKKWCNLSTGGQAINMTHAMFTWANEQKKVKDCLIDVSFYQLSRDSRSSSVQPVFYIAEHPLKYIVTWDYVAEAWTSLANAIKRNDSPIYTHEKTIDIEQIIASDNKYRKDLLDYALYNIYPDAENYSVDSESLTWIIDLIKTVKENNGCMRILYPCVQESIWEYVLEPLKIEPAIQEYKAILSAYPINTYDMEWKNPLCKNQDVYADGFHFKNRGFYNLYYTENIFSPNHDENVIIRLTD